MVRPVVELAWNVGFALGRIAGAYRKIRRILSSLSSWPPRYQ